MCKQCYIYHWTVGTIVADFADRLAQARTGTGKTLAFLIPVLQNIINVDPQLEHPSARRTGSASDIRAIIISPTRELAEQIAVEAKKVSRKTGVIVQTAVGGSQKSEGLRRIKNEGCHILVGTPGRLNDILSDQYSQVRAPNLSAFILDEADRLLDQGFAPEIKAIQDLLPDRRERDRQTLLYSATVPREVMQVVRKIMKPDFQYVRTVQEGEPQTHEKVPQKMVNVGGFENIMPALVELCKREINGGAATTDSPERPFKAIVYFGATADVILASAVLQNLNTPGRTPSSSPPLHPAKIIEIHARLSQYQRTRAADNFRRAKCGIMLSSDVTARGMDFPNVTHVIQIGIPPSQEQYVHRIGRTARGDKTGEGWIMITNLESREIRLKLSNMPLEQDNSLETAKVDMRKDAQLPEGTAQTLTQVQEAIKMAPRSMKVAAYGASLGIYSWVPRKQVLIDALNDRAKYGWGMEQPPMIAPKLAQKLGLSRLQGINLGHEERAEGGYGDSRGGSNQRLSFGRGSRDDGGSSRERYSSSSFGRGSRDDGGSSRERYSSSSFGGGRGDAGRSSYRGGGDRGRVGDRADHYTGGKSRYEGGPPRDGFSPGGERGGFSRGGRGGGDRGGYGGGRGFDRRDGGRESRYSQ